MPEDRNRGDGKAEPLPEDAGVESEYVANVSEDVPSQLVDAAEQQLEYPADETDEG